MKVTDNNYHEFDAELMGRSGRRHPRIGSFVLEVCGAGWLALGGSITTCGVSTGISIEASWGSHGFAGGTMHLSEVKRLRDHLNRWLEENEPKIATHD
jgi:hypothetical protein